jgi:hypothetical protein
MVNIFEKLITTSDYFSNLNLGWDLFYYLYDNLENENDTLRRNLENTLTNNANGKYI